MSWQVIVDCRTKEDAENVESLIDMALDSGTGVLENVVSLCTTAYELCEVDFMAGQLCRLPAGHDDGHR